MKEGNPFVFTPPDWARRVQFYLTAPQPCPYLQGKKERKIFANLAVENADGLNQSLSWAGFRRSQNIIYRPACASCSACRSVRIPVARFAWSKRWRRIEKANANLMRVVQSNQATEEQFALLSRYLNTRHKGGGMNEMSFADYVGMVEASPVRSVVVEYREQPDPKLDDAQSDQAGILRAAALTDVLDDGLSVIYSFFDPDEKKRSLGSFMILDALRRAADLNMPYVYLGYWVKGSEKMQYKAAFRPLQTYDGRIWRALTDRELALPSRPVHKTSMTGASGA